MLNHIGNSAYQGHYVCEAMDWSNGVWWKANDDEVTFLPNGPKHLDSEAGQASGSDVEIITPQDDTAAPGKSPKNVAQSKGSEDAYMLVYVKKSYLRKHVVEDSRTPEDVMRTVKKENEELKKKISDDKENTKRRR